MAEHEAAAGQLHLLVTTHERTVLDVACDEVTLPGKLGYFGVLPGHIPLISTLKVGELMYRQGKREHYMALSWGFAEVADDTVTVLAEFAEEPAEIDLAAAEREAAEAQALLGSTADEELARALARLETAVTRIQVARRPR